MKILNKVKNFLGLGSPEPKIAPDKPVQERMRTGNPNGILGVHERNLSNQKQNKALKNRKKRKLANKARNQSH